MTSTLVVICLWALFIATHLGVSSSDLRSRCVEHFGPRGFVLAYSLVSAAQLSAIGAYMAMLPHHAANGAHLQGAARYALIALSVLGAMLISGGLAGYARSAVAVLARRARKSQAGAGPALAPPTGIERITRHPFFLGLVMLMGAHALFASTPAQALYFGGYAALALLGIVLQDRKLQRLHGEVYAAHLRRTAVLPSLAATPSPPLPVAAMWRTAFAMLIGAGAIAALHPVWQWRHGAGFVFAISLFGLLALVKQMRHADAAPLA
jgi:uncharacterized membrane protein